MTLGKAERYFRRIADVKEGKHPKLIPYTTDFEQQALDHLAELCAKAMPEKLVFKKEHEDMKSSHEREIRELKSLIEFWKSFHEKSG